MAAATWATVLLAVVARPAKAAGVRVAVPKFEGTNEAEVRKKVMQVLKAHGFELVRSRDVQEGLDRIDGSLESELGLQNLAKELALSAIVTGEVSRKRAKIEVHNGIDGSTMGGAVFAGANPRKLADEVGRNFWRKLGGEVESGRVPANARKRQKASRAASPEDDEESPEEGDSARSEDEKPAADQEPAGPPSPVDTEAKNKKEGIKMEGGTEPATERPQGSNAAVPWVDVEIGGGGYHRQLSYNQNISTNVLLPYSLELGPVAVADGVIYPLDPLLGGLLGNLGVEGAIQQGLLISSQAATGNRYSNVVHDFAGGLRFRFLLGGDIDLHVSVSYGEDAFTFSGTGRSALFIPDTIYRYVRPGLGLNLPLGHTAFSLRMAGGYRYVANRGGAEISGESGFFPHLTVAGADAEFQGAYDLNDLLEVRIGAGIRRYWYSMHSVASDLGSMGNGYAAGGAIDQSFTFTATLAFVLGARRRDAVSSPTALPAPKTGSPENEEVPDESGGDTESSSN